MSNPGSYTLQNTDVDDITDAVIQEAKQAFNEQLKIAWENRSYNTTFTDDATKEWAPADINDYVAACASSQYFTGVSDAYDAGAEPILNASTADAAALKQAMTPTCSLAVSKIMNAMWAAKNAGEANRDAGLNPDGTEPEAGESLPNEEEEALIFKSADKSYSSKSIRLTRTTTSKTFIELSLLISPNS